MHGLGPQLIDHLRKSMNVNHTAWQRPNSPVTGAVLQIAPISWWINAGSENAFGGAL